MYLHVDVTHGSLSPRKSAPKWHLDRFSRFYRAHRFTQLHKFQYLSKVPFPVGESGPRCNTRFLGPLTAHIAKRLTIGSSIFAGLAHLGDQHTDALTCTLRQDLHKNSLHLAHCLQFC